MKPLRIFFACLLLTLSSAGLEAQTKAQKAPAQQKQTLRSRPSPAQALPSKSMVRDFPKERFDVGDLNPEQRERLIRLLNAHPCSCGCSYSTASCLVRDVRCGTSPRMAATVRDAVLAGKSDAEIQAVLQKAFPPPPPRKRPAPEDPNKRYVVDPGDSPRRGAKRAPVQIVEFMDYQCPFCARAFKTMEKLLKTYPNELALYVKNYPLSMHPQAAPAARAAEAAAKQGKFWPMHDALLTHPLELRAGKIDEIARTAGLKMKKFQKAMQSSQSLRRVEDDKALAKKVGVSSTPTFFINGRKVRGAKSYEAFKKLIDKELAKLRKNHATEKTVQAPRSKSSTAKK